MKRLSLLFVLLFICRFNDAFGQEDIPAYTTADLVQRIAHQDTIYVVNFWATWCVPCVKELPAFDVIADLYKGQPVKVILLSFDFKEQYPAQLTSWVKKKGLKPEVVWFSESNPNDYIPKIAPEWTGTLPGTLLVNPGKGQRKFMANEVNADELKAWIDNNLQ